MKSVMTNQTAINAPTIARCQNANLPALSAVSQAVALHAKCSVEIVRDLRTGAAGSTPHVEHREAGLQA